MATKKSDKKDAAAEIPEDPEQHFVPFQMRADQYDSEDGEKMLAKLTKEEQSRFLQTVVKLKGTSPKEEKHRQGIIGRLERLIAS